MSKINKKIILIIIFCLLFLVINVQNVNANSMFNNISNWFTGTLKKESTINILIDKDPENGLKANITATDSSSKIIKLKLKKLDSYDEKVDFNTQGTEIPITPGNTVTAEITVREEGIYKIAAINENNYMLIKTVLLYTDYFMTMELNENVDNPGEIQIQANDRFSNIVKLKIAKTSDIENSGIPEDKRVINYFKEYGYGNDIPITPGKTVNATYNVIENAYYTVYIEDEMKNSYAKQVIVNAIPEEGIKASINYNITKYTNKPVVATITFNKEDVEITNNNGSNQYTFNENGEFIFEYTDILNNKGQAKASVTWIDKNPPIISNITEGTVYERNVTPIIEDRESSISVRLEKNGEIVNYDIGQEISENGNYTLTVTDEAGNSTTVNFSIKKVEQKDDTITSNTYNVSNDRITRVKPETSVRDFKNKINCEVSYTIKDYNGNEISDNSYIGTRFKVVTETGREYIVVVLADSDGNGKIDLVDVGKATKIYLGTIQVDEIEKLVYDLDENGKIDLIDIGKLPKVYLKTLSL